MLAVVERAEGFAASLVGEDEASARAQATAAGFAIRVARRDEVSLVITSDLRPTRINITLEDGLVTDVEVFGPSTDLPIGTRGAARSVLA